jgi:hypothetical protein
MSIKMTIQGIDIVASSAEEAAALVREFSGLKGLRGQVMDFDQPTQFADPGPDGQRAIAFLEEIRSAAPDGPTTDDIMRVLETESTKGVGGRLTRVNKLLAEAGFDPSTVYQNPRTAGGRVWRPGSAIQQAIRKLREGYKK